MFNFFYNILLCKSHEEPCDVYTLGKKLFNFLYNTLLCKSHGEPCDVYTLGKKIV
jgi:hypothetical protein